MHKRWPFRSSVRVPLLLIDTCNFLPFCAIVWSPSIYLKRQLRDRSVTIFSDSNGENAGEVLPQASCSPDSTLIDFHLFGQYFRTGILSTCHFFATESEAWRKVVENGAEHCERWFVLCINIRKLQRKDRDFYIQLIISPASSLGATQAIRVSGKYFPTFKLQILRIEHTHIRIFYLYSVLTIDICPPAIFETCVEHTSPVSDERD